MPDPRLDAIKAINPGISDTDAASMLVEGMGQVKREQQATTAQQLQQAQPPGIINRAAQGFGNAFGNVSGTAAYGLDQVVGPTMRALGAQPNSFTSLGQAQQRGREMAPTTPGGVAAFLATLGLGPVTQSAMAARPVLAAGSRIGIAGGSAYGAEALAGNENPGGEAGKQMALTAGGEIAGPVLRLVQSGLVRASDAAGVGKVIQTLAPVFANNGTAADLLQIAKGQRGATAMRQQFQNMETVVKQVAGANTQVSVPSLNQALGNPPGGTMAVTDALNEVKKLGDRAFQSYGANTFELRQAYRQAQQELTGEFSRLTAGAPRDLGAIYTGMRDAYSKQLEIQGLLNTPGVFGGTNKVKLNTEALQRAYTEELAEFQKRGLTGLEGPLYRGGQVGTTDQTVRIFPRLFERGMGMNYPGGVPLTKFTGGAQGTATPQTAVDLLSQYLGDAATNR